MFWLLVFYPVLYRIIIIINNKYFLSPTNTLFHGLFTLILKLKFYINLTQLTPVIKFNIIQSQDSAGFFISFNTLNWLDNL